MRLPLLLSTQLFIDGWVAHENYDAVQKLISELEETWDENISFPIQRWRAFLLSLVILTNITVAFISQYFDEIMGVAIFNLGAIMTCVDGNDSLQSFVVGSNSDGKRNYGYTSHAAVGFEKMSMEYIRCWENMR